MYVHKWLYLWTFPDIFNTVYIGHTFLEIDFLSLVFSDFC